MKSHPPVFFVNNGTIKPTPVVAKLIHKATIKSSVGGSACFISRIKRRQSVDLASFFLLLSLFKILLNFRKEMFSTAMSLL